MVGSLHGFVVGRCRSLGMNLDTLALKVGVSTKTLYTKSTHPEKFQLWELRNLFDCLSMTAEERTDYLKSVGMKI